MLKMVMIAYNEAVDAEVMEILGNCTMKNYTKLTGAFGRGVTSGVHEGNDIWPGRNNILYVACEEKQAKQMLSCIKELRKKLGKEGIKAFVMPVEDVT
jgi:nitrogen regulatory protein PII